MKKPIAMKKQTSRVGVPRPRSERKHTTTYHEIAEQRDARPADLDLGVTEALENEWKQLRPEGNAGRRQ
jgi:hypothetical protein